MFTMIEPSPHDPATAYVTATRYKNDDYAPYVYKTSDYGASWQLIVDGIAEDHFCRVVREDPEREGLLYLGTEFGLYVSFDGGGNWQRFQLNLPVSPIYDLKLKGSNLVIATHGRSFWILDDVTVLHQLYSPHPPNPFPHKEGRGARGSIRLATGDESPFPLYGGRGMGMGVKRYVYSSRALVERHLPKVFEGLFESGEGKQYMSTLGAVAAYVKEETPEHGVNYKYLDSGANPAKGAVFTYYLPEKAEATISLRIDAADGTEVKTFKSIHADEEDKAKLAFPDASGKGPGDGEEKELRIPSNAGWNRFIWDLRYPDAHRVMPHNDNQQGFIKGPHAVPGAYRVTLTVGDEQRSQDFEIVKEAGVEASQADLNAQFDLLITIRDKVSATHKLVNQMRDARAQLKGWHGRLKGLETAAGILDAAKALEEQILEVEKELMIPDTRPGWPDAMNHGDRLAMQLSSLSFNVNLGDYKPTDYEYGAFDEIAADIDGVAEKFEDIVDGNLAEFNTMLSNAGFGIVALKVE